MISAPVLMLFAEDALCAHLARDLADREFARTDIDWLREVMDSDPAGAQTWGPILPEHGEWTSRSDLKGAEVRVHEIDLDDREQEASVEGSDSTSVRSAADTVMKYLESLPESANEKMLREAFEQSLGMLAVARLEARGMARMLLVVLDARGVAVDEAARTTIVECTDPDQLQRWGHRAANAKALDEVFAEHGAG